MTKYIFKETATATETNKNFDGVITHYWHGTKGANLDGNHDCYVSWFAKHYGFKTKAAASKAMKHYKEHLDWFEETFHTWTHKLEIVAVEIDGE